MSAATRSIAAALETGRAWLESQTAQTQRLRPLLAAVAVVLLIGLVLTTANVANQRAIELKTAQTELARLAAEVKEGSWPARKQQSETLRFQLFERFWVAETAGLAEASLERWLRERSERLGLKPDSIRVQRANIAGTRDGESQFASMAGVQRMTAKVIMPFDPEALFQLLSAAADNDKILVVDRLLIRAGRNALIEMDVSTFVRLSEPAR
jgi:hypothetical protein